MNGNLCRCGELRVGAGVRNSDLANHPVVRERYPYFQDVTMPSDKREPGSGCQAAEPGAETGNMAILGHSPFCVATHPSDMAVALTAAALAMPGVLSVLGGVTTRPFGTENFELALFTSDQIAKGTTRPHAISGRSEEEPAWPCQTALTRHGAARAGGGGSGASSRG